MTRYFWTLFFLGSLLAVAIDVRERRMSIDTQSELSGGTRALDGDPFGDPLPTPKP